MVNLLVITVTVASLTLIGPAPAIASLSSETEFAVVLAQKEKIGWYLSTYNDAAEATTKDLDCFRSSAPGGLLGYTAIAHVKVEADEVYMTALREIEARPYINILRQDDEKYLVEVTGGEKKISLKAIPINKNNQTKIIVTADVPQEGLAQEEELKREEKLALKAIRVLCDSLGVKYELVDCTIALTPRKQLRPGIFPPLTLGLLSLPGGGPSDREAMAARAVRLRRMPASPVSYRQVY